MEKKERKKFYEKFMQFNGDKMLISLLNKYLPYPKENEILDQHGIIIAERKNDWIEEDKKNYPNKHPVEKYTLVYGHRNTGFIMREYWKGDFFPHISHKYFKIKKGVPFYMSDERGGKWEVLDAFPNLTIKELEKKIYPKIFEIGINLEERVKKEQDSLRKLAQDFCRLTNSYFPHKP